MRAARGWTLLVTEDDDEDSAETYPHCAPDNQSARLLLAKVRLIITQLPTDGETRADSCMSVRLVRIALYRVAALSVFDITLVHRPGIIRVQRVSAESCGLIMMLGM